jgi:hypothetical protein
VTAVEQATALVVTSPIPSHPDTTIIEQTVASIRAHLPGVEIVVAADGVNPALADEHPERVDAYATYLRRLVRLCRHDWDALPLLAPGWLHQEALTRWALEHVRTPLVLFCEHDTPLADEPVDWDGCARVVQSGALNSIRMAHEAFVLPDHEYLMLDDGPVDIGGVPVRRTVQFSARPHLASAGWYRTILRAWFSEDSRAFIEDRLYGVLLDQWRRHGEAGWAEFRTAIYHPDGNIKRSVHLDGRDGDPKLDTEQTW